MKYEGHTTIDLDRFKKNYGFYSECYGGKFPCGGKFLVCSNPDEIATYENSIAHLDLHFWKKGFFKIMKISYVGVDEPFRHRGIASNLIALAITQAEAMGIYRIEIQPCGAPFLSEFYSNFSFRFLLQSKKLTILT